MTKDQLISGIRQGNIRALSKAITLAESTINEKKDIALDIIEHFGPQENTHRIGITGTPGAGKSTFIEAAGIALLQNTNNKVAVLSVDPTSERTSGSILGDKTRMTTLANHERAYVRPTASGTQLGGLAKNTRLAMLLCEAAGYTHILIESVGVGQGETEVAQLTDVFVLLLNPGGGDELQGIKRGIMEMADILVVNKADGDLKKQASLTATEYSMALHLHSESENKWSPKVLIASALMGDGIAKFWEQVDAFFTHVGQNNVKVQRRDNQKYYWAKKALESLLLAQLEGYKNKIQEGLSKGTLPERLAASVFKQK